MLILSKHVELKHSVCLVKYKLFNQSKFKYILQSTFNHKYWLSFLSREEKYQDTSYDKSGK